jgi:anthranilate synthase/aminodeoxychorismate synthase-like glutamine amidotransferase
VICVIDNYDSFVYNLVQYSQRLGFRCVVFRNDAVTVDEVVDLEPELVIVSPGPGGPGQAGISVELIRQLGGRVPLFGVCLGHQCIGHAFGAEIVHAARPMHGKCSSLRHDGCGLFADLPDPVRVARYHSLVIDPATVPDELEVTAWSEDGEVMGVRHRTFQIEGVQFHPESLFTDHGVRMVSNVLRAAHHHEAAERMVRA